MIASPHQGKLLTAHQSQGISNDCGPVCVAIILNTFNTNPIDGLALGQQLNKIEWKSGLPKIYRIKNWVVFPWGITAYFRQSGFKAHIRMRKNLDWAYQKMADGKILMPIIGGWNPLWGHYLIPVAWERGKKIGFCNPASDTNIIDYMEENKFSELWKWSLNSIIEITV